MSYFGKIKVTNRLNWIKMIDIEKSLCLIGSSPSNDVVLNEEFGGGVAPRHLQLICPKTPNGQFRLINLSNNDIQVFDSSLVAQGSIISKSTHVLRDGDTIQVGDFSLQFHFQTQRGILIERRTENIGVKLEMLGTQLKPNKVLSGRLTLTNLGEERRCQFMIELEGLPTDCYQITPAPLLFPGATDELTFKFYHRKVRPQAGEVQLQFLASAVDTYPTELISIPLTLDVHPVHQYSLSVLNDEKPDADVLGEPVIEEALAAPLVEIVVETEKPPVVVPAPESHVVDRAEMIENKKTADTTIADKVPEVLSAVERVTAAPTWEMDEAQETANGKKQITDSEKVHIESNEEPTESIELGMDQEEEESWWTEDVNARASQTKANPLNAVRKDIKSRLAGKDIQVIKAGSEVEDEEGASKLNDTPRDE